MQIKNKKWKNINISIIVIIVLILFFEILPRIWDLGKTSIEFIENSKKLEKIDEVDSKLKELTIENRNLKAVMNKIVSNYEENKNISSTMRYLNDISNKSHISISSIKPLKLNKRENLWLQPIEIEFYSNYEQLYNFIRFLEYSKKVMLITEITVVPKIITHNKLKVITKIDVYLNL